MLVVSIGLGIFIRYLFLFFFGGATQQFPEFSGQEGLELGPLAITPKAIIGAIAAIIAILASIYWLLKTRMGKASRAVADNPALASASGIDVERVINVVWILGATLAALSGILVGLTSGVSWNMGQQILLLIFAAVTVGGLGTAFGALLGSIIVGLLIQLSTLVIPPELKSVGALFILIIILLVRPQGLLGRRERIG
jgi:branched-chain amino acid transport system permease protein